MPTKLKKRGKKTMAALCALVLVASYAVIPVTNAASTVSTSDTLSDSRPSTDSNHTITFTTPTGASAGDTIVLTFDSAFTFTDVDFADIDLKDDSTEITLAASCGTTETSAVFSSNVLTFTLCPSATAIGAGSVIEVEIGTNADSGTDQITNPALNGCSGSSSVCDIDITGTFGDTGTAQIVLIDGVSVSATVDEYLTFSIDDNAVGFGTWTGGSTVERFATLDENGSIVQDGTPFTLSVSSNGAGGVSITVKSLNAGLYSAGASHTLSAVASSAVAGGSEGYGVYGLGIAGLTVSEGFDDDGTADVAVSTSNQVFATSASAPVTGSVYGALNAAISATTPAGAYSDTVVFVATPTF